MSIEYWQDSHILYDVTTGMYIAYDEAGLQVGKYSSIDEARTVLQKHDDQLEADKGAVDNG